MQEIFDEIISEAPTGRRKPGWKDVRPYTVEDYDTHADNSDDNTIDDNNDAGEHDNNNNNNNAIDEDMKPQETSKDELYFDINGSRYIPYNPKQNAKEKEQPKDDLPPYVFKSNKPLFLCIFDDITSSPCLEIIEDTVEQLEGVEITCAIENVVVCEHTDSSEVKVASVNDYMEFLMRLTNRYVSRMSRKSNRTKTFKKCYDVCNKTPHTQM